VKDFQKKPLPPHGSPDISFLVLCDGLSAAQQAMKKDGLLTKYESGR
jgi:hypothetical protein